MSALYDRIVELLTTRFGVSPEDVRPDATFEELDVDSLSLVEFTLTVQSELGVELRDDKATLRDTLSDVVALLETNGARI